MKSFPAIFLFVAITGITFSCSKAEDSGPACEVNETTKVTFKNNSATTLRVEVAKTFNAQFMPVDAVFTIDIEPGGSAVKEFRYGRYFTQWKSNCATTCSQKAFYAKDFNQCEEYEEVQ